MYVRVYKLLHSRQTTVGCIICCIWTKSDESWLKSRDLLDITSYTRFIFTVPLPSEPNLEPIVARQLRLPSQTMHWHGVSEWFEGLCRECWAINASGGRAQPELNVKMKMSVALAKLLDSTNPLAHCYTEKSKSNSGNSVDPPAPEKAAFVSTPKLISAPVINTFVSESLSFPKGKLYIMFSFGSRHKTSQNTAKLIIKCALFLLLI